MASNLILLPALVQVLLTLLVYAALAVAKARAIKGGLVDLDRRALHDDAWPDSVMKINNNIRNQFELPVLFYVVCFVLWGLEAVGTLALVAAWLFVVSRIAHAWVHLTSNYIPNRRRLFTAGWWILLFMVLLAAWQLIGRAVI